MKKLPGFFSALVLLAIVCIIDPVYSQNDYKHPQLNSSGQVLDSVGTKLGWITSEGIVYNAKGEKVAKIERQDLVDYKGHKLGKIGKDGTLYDPNGVLLFTIEPNSKGEKCKVFDPEGKVIATVHESYKNQACAIHCLNKKMPAH